MKRYLIIIIMLLFGISAANAGDTLWSKVTYPVQTNFVKYSPD
ncbi:MAG: hypothetical protein NT007_13310 [Candidatus Kapabacteria bacterium]|nr:hypothetical protein [Candidatus Kapabacteria bacterium]